MATGYSPNKLRVHGSRVYWTESGVFLIRSS